MTPRTSGNEAQVLIIGSGFGGLGAASQLRRHGFDDLVILERAEEVGGVWRDNRYPGCACDVQSHLYSFSFAPNPEWSRSYSGQAEIWAYLQRCAREAGLLPQIRFGHTVREARWEPGRQRWRVETSRGTFWARVLVSAAGALSEPALPDLPGRDSFAGPAFHSARWDHEVELRGRRVAVVGTGASAVQFVPAIQPQAGRLLIFQRTPPWVLPRGERAIGPATRRLLRRFPGLQRLLRAGIYGWREIFVLGFRHPWIMRYFERGALRQLARAIPDPKLRARLTPSYRIGCKRILLSDNYLPALAQPNVEVVTEAIAEVRERAIVTVDGVERPVDVIIYGTGFHVTEMPLARTIYGRAGRSLAEVWAGRPRAHLGTTVAGFPNLFLLQGPHTVLAHSSVVIMIEAQVAHLVNALRHMRSHGVAAVEPRPEAQAAFVADVERRMRGTVWATGGCRSWYLDATGHNAAIWPGFTWQFRRRVAPFRPHEYLLSS